MTENISASVRSDMTQDLASLGQVKSEEKTIHKLTSSTGLQAFQQLREILQDIGNNVIAFHPGISPLEANCRIESKDVSQLILSNNCFKLESKQTDPKEDSTSRLSQLMVSTAGALDKTDKTQNDQAINLLNYGKEQLSLNQEWKGQLKGYIAKNSALLELANPQQKKMLKNGLEQAEKCLMKADSHISSLEKGVSALSKSVDTDAASKETGSKISPQRPGQTIVYRLMRK